MRVAVIGSGIAGLSAAHALRGHAHVTLFEAGSHFGGHAHTVDVTIDGVSHGVDMGFLVFNRRTYPGLVNLFAGIGVPQAESDMSFSVQASGEGGSVLEWGGASLLSVFCQARNIARPAFWRMLADLRRFNALATRLARAGTDPEQSLGQLLASEGFSRQFQDWYLLPMLGCIWSCPPRRMLDFPALGVLRFCDNHGLLQVTGRPQWYTVAGGSREYVRRIVRDLPDARLSTPVKRVQRMAGGVQVATAQGTEYFDRAVIAVHPGDALAMLTDPSADEARLLGAIRYQGNRAVLHRDTSQLPRRRAAWSAWNYESGSGEGETRVCLHYLINRLQPLPWRQPVIVSLNPLRPIDPALVHAERDFDHPVLDAAAVRAQGELDRIQQGGPVWFCGAWTGHGFHEDGFRSGALAASRVLATLGQPALSERLAA